MAQPTVALFSSLQKIFPEDSLPGAQGTAFRLELTRGEAESFQIGVRSAEPIHHVRIEIARPAALAAVTIAVYREHFVQIRQPSGNRIIVPRRWPDALIPVAAAPTNVAANENCIFWITVRAPREMPPAVDRLAVSVFGDNKLLAALPLPVMVHEITLPLRPMVRATAALYYPTVLDWYNKHVRHGKPPWTADSPEWQRLKRMYYEFLLSYGICAYELPVPLDSPEAARYLSDPRVHFYRLPWIGNDLPRFRRLVAELAARGQLGGAFYYQADEPQPSQYGDIRHLGEMLHATKPPVRQLVTMRPTDEVRDSVDIWCPDIGDFGAVGHLDFDDLRRHMKPGDELWWYTCCVPVAPYPTWLVDDDAAAVRAYGWMMARYDIRGFVYSMVHGWGPDPFADVTSFADTNGDGLLLYPGELVGVEGPLPSIRLEILRDAIEDQTLLELLGQRVNREAVVANTERVFTDLKHFARDAQPYLDARRDLFTELDAADAGIAVIQAEPRGHTLLTRAQIAVRAPDGATVTIGGTPTKRADDGLYRAAVPLKPGPDLVPIRVAVAGQTYLLQRIFHRDPGIGHPRQTIVAQRTATAPHLDGGIWDAVWQQAQPVTLDLRQSGFNPATVPTVVRALWDAKELYLAFDAPFAKPQQTVPSRNWVGIELLSQPPDRTPRDHYYFLVTTARGNRHAELRALRGVVLSDVKWRGEAFVNQHHFTVEMALPFSSFGGPPTPGSSWQINFLRRCGAELDVWIPNQRDIDDLGILVFAGNGDRARR